MIPLCWSIVTMLETFIETLKGQFNKNTGSIVTCLQSSTTILIAFSRPRIWFILYCHALFGSFCYNCRIHHVTASMTTIDLIIKPRTELLEPVTTLFKLAAPSISSCALSIYFSQFLPLLLFSSYPLPTLTMDHIPLSKCGGLWTFVYPPCMQNAMASEVLYGLIRPR